MLRIVIDLLPYGDEDDARTLSTIEIANVSGPGRLSQDYAWRVRRPDQEDEHGYVLDHWRGDAVDLLHAVLCQREFGGLPKDNHGRVRSPEGMPEDPALAWRGAGPEAP